ncbi:isoleucine--tRNA ligase [candidate division WWE3 bacterium]|nr:isoleucine--tRNA ligase [candidate division WWE3 bacterium]
MKDPGTTPHFPDLEKETLQWWEKEHIFRKTLEKTKEGTPFIFYEGPPTANGKPHIGHVLGRSYKDLFPRFKTMQGYHVPRKAGWDSHGLPVELEIEKELGITGKQQIEEFGIEEFNKKCRESVFRHIEIWQNLTKRMGFWVDLDDAYVVMSNNYIESLWWVLKNMWDQNLLKKDYKVAPYCPRCQTPISSHELAQGYQDNVPDPSLFVLFEINQEIPDIPAGLPVYFLAWTTTPWTLLGNVALAVDPEANYVAVKTLHPTTNTEIIAIVAQPRLSVLSHTYEVVKHFTGSELVSITYKPLFDYIKYEQKAHYVVPADFVSMEDGSGIVHTAVMYGEDDFELGKKFNLPRQHAVKSDGTYTEECGEFAGRPVLKANNDIVSQLTEKGNIYKHETIHHTYPFCWRCKNKLIYYALDSWFIATSEKKDQLIANNEQINWYPEHIRDGRMGDWLRNIKDWSLSRWRYWGTPLPIWKCQQCNHETLIGSFDELQKRSDQPIDIESFDPHRPYIDRITLTCDTCGSQMKRYEDVLDTWFDSGGMPYAQLHFPFENTDEFNARFPADFICEGLDQTRGWFYTLIAEATMLDKGIPSKNILCHEMVLDSNGRKMSKSVGNVIDPFETFEEFGADIIRWYFYSSSQIGKPYRLGKKELQEVKQRFINILWNSYRFFATNALLDNWTPQNEEDSESSHLLDQWILARLNETVHTVTESLEQYDAYTSSRAISEFVVADLSQWYIRRSRDRVGPSATNLEDKNAFYQTIYTVFMTLSKIMAPFTPFLADVMYRNLRTESDPISVHLSDWPKETTNQDSQNIIDGMSMVRAVAERIHAIRKEANIKVRQPLAEARISTNYVFAPKEKFVSILSDEVNIRQITIIPLDTDELDVQVDTEITDQLKQEGLARDLIRSVQELRRDAGYALNQRIVVYVENPSEYIKSMLLETSAVIQDKLLADRIEQAPASSYNAKAEVTLDGQAIIVGVQAV